MNSEMACCSYAGNFRFQPTPTIARRSSPNFCSTFPLRAQRAYVVSHEIELQQSHKTKNKTNKIEEKKDNGKIYTTQKRRKDRKLQSSKGV